MRNLYKVLVVGAIFIMAMCVMNKLGICGLYGARSSSRGSTGQKGISCGPNCTKYKKPAGGRKNRGRWVFVYNRNGSTTWTGGPPEEDTSGLIRNREETEEGNPRRGPVHGVIRDKRAQRKSRIRFVHRPQGYGKRSNNYNNEMMENIRNIKSMLKIIGAKLRINFPERLFRKGGIGERIKNLQKIVGYFEKKSGYNLPNITREDLNTGKVSKKLKNIEKKLINIGKELGLSLNREEYLSNFVRNRDEKGEGDRRTGDGLIYSPVR